MEQLIDEAGRPLAESNSTVPFPHVSALCPYPDSRLGSKMNAGGLQQVASHWESILEWVVHRSPRDATVHQALEVALVATVEPLFQRVIPDPMAARYKACFGFCQSFFALALGEPRCGTLRLAEVSDGEQFFRSLEGQGLLHGEREVCAGPKSMILALFEGFCNGSRESEFPETRLARKSMEAVALHCSHWSGLYRAGKPVGESFQTSAPWLLAATARPGVEPDFSRRLFRGDPPPSLARLLTNPGDVELFASLVESIATDV